MNNRLLNPFFSSLFFLFILIVYISLIIFFDNTNLATGNGLYKSVDVLGWEKGTKFVVDSGGLLYAFSMGMIAKLIPDTWVTFYGTITDFFTYRKITYIHGFFGALASTTVLILAYQVTRDRILSIIISILHAISAFILVNSITSEDIMPGYFFFCVSFYCFYQALTTENKRFYFTGTTFSVLGAMFLHWTLFPPIICSYGLISLWMMKEDKKYIRLFLEQLSLFFGLVLSFVITANTLFSSHFKSKLKFLKILYPSKAESGSWVGFCWHKFESLYIGIGNFLVGGQNIPTFSAVTGSNFLRTLLSWSITLGTVWVSIYIFKYSALKKYKILAVMGISIFVFGQLQNMYGQPQDPQFQVQPMFIIVVGLILLGSYKKKLKFFKMILSVLTVIVGIDNFSTYKSLQGVDSQMVKGFQEFRTLFPKEQVRLVHQAYEGWSPWLMIFDYQASFDIYLKDVSCLNTPFHFNPGISVKEAGQKIMEEINIAIEQGKKIIVTTPWVNPSYLDVLQSQNLTKSEVEELRQILLNHYQVKKTYNLLWGEFAEIERK